ncbi:hypothetical protein Gogos_005622 [Gossypium gossypioides]|uniref:Uncharacterized protein n=1 Tax=Gossypium gossypioides TaxID=34282 RepID=A0A7J9D6E0_GOSGO|nr:hypothetical protein [Gossypium gossypioides]
MNTLIRLTLDNFKNFLYSPSRGNSNEKKSLQPNSLY